MTPKEEVLALAHDMMGEGATTTAIALVVARYVERRALERAAIKTPYSPWAHKLHTLPSEYE